jgi:hypothetical protein
MAGFRRTAGSTADRSASADRCLPPASAGGSAPNTSIIFSSAGLDTRPLLLALLRDAQVDIAIESALQFGMTKHHADAQDNAYDSFVDHPRYGRRPHITGLNPQPFHDGVHLHWNSQTYQELKAAYE